MISLKITHTNGQIGVRTTPAKMRIRQPKPKFRMKQKSAEMVVENIKPKMVIDQTEAFADMGNKTILRLMDDFAKISYDICTEAIGRIAREGTKISKAGKNRGDIVRQIIIEKMTDDKSEVNVAALPRNGPDIYWEKGYFKVNWKIHSPEIEWEVSARAEIDVEPHTVEIYMRKYPSLEIEIVEKNNKSGKKVNRKV